MSTSVKFKGPVVHRAPAAAVWEHEHRWGTLLGDSTTLYVRRTDGGALSIAYGSEKIEIRAALVEHLAEMVAAAAEWTDVSTTTDGDPT